ncbi:MAG: M48 family metalloprotease [Candidatus Obscuribacterales bacterium]|nr:M48 family metalloprotease [Candidatus Obscuribacterales bacterium]
MPMGAAEFEELVARLELFSRQNPGGYRLRVAALALLLYVYVLAVLILLLGLGFAVFAVLWQAKSAYFLSFKLALPLAILAYLILRSFLIRFSPPRGVMVSAEDSPKIFELLLEIKGKLDCPRIEAVYLNSEFNASIYSMPRLGFLGAHKHYLCLGLPLMQSLSPEQFRAVLAHEMGHLSGNHGKFSSWIYSVRSASLQLLEVVREQSMLGNFVFKVFLEWYCPLFNAYSFVLIRQHEYEADKCAAEIFGTKTAALSLINSELKNRYVDLKYWKELFKNLDETPMPPSHPFRDLSELMVNGQMDPEAYKWYQQALARRTGSSQSHPSLRDRIKAISELGDCENLENLSEEELRKAWAIDTSAAQEYFEAKLPDFEQRLDIAWHNAFDQNWRCLYGERIEARNQLHKLEQKMQTEQLSNDELLQRAQLYFQLKPSIESIPVLRNTLLVMPDNASLNYNLGERLLADGDLSGIDYLEKVISLKPVYGLELCEIIYQHLMDEGKEEQAAVYLDRTFKYRNELDKAARERAGLKDGDKYYYKKLADQELLEILKHFPRYQEIKQAFLVCKEVSTFVERPFYILVLEISYPIFKVVSSDAKKQLVQTLGALVALPSEGYVIEIGWAPNKLKKFLHDNPECRIFKRY